MIGTQDAAVCFALACLPAKLRRSPCCPFSRLLPLLWLSSCIGGATTRTWTSVRLSVRFAGRQALGKHWGFKHSLRALYEYEYLHSYSQHLPSLGWLSYLSHLSYSYMHRPNITMWLPVQQIKLPQTKNRWTCPEEVPSVCTVSIPRKHLQSRALASSSLLATARDNTGSHGSDTSIPATTSAPYARRSAARLW